MHLLHPAALPLLLLAVTPPPTAALQNIFIGYMAICDSVYHAIVGFDTVAWFTDAPICKVGTLTNLQVPGPESWGCTGGPFTIQGHTGITFTGCNAPNPGCVYTNPYPAYVYDNGVLALKCEKVAITGDPCNYYNNTAYPTTSCSVLGNCTASSGAYVLITERCVNLNS